MISILILLRVVTTCYGSFVFWAASWQNQQNGMCAQQRLWSVWADVWRKLGSLASHWAHSEDSDQSGRMHEESLGHAALIRLGGCPGWSESSLDAYAILLVLSWGGSFFFLYLGPHQELARITVFFGRTHLQLGVLTCNSAYSPATGRLWFFSRTFLYVSLTFCFSCLYLSRLMIKPTKWLCAQRILRSAWASAQSDQSLRCPHYESLVPELPTERSAKTLIRLDGCPGWSESSLGAL